MEKNQYHKVKPILNKLAKHNIEDNFRVIRYYVQQSFPSCYQNKDKAIGIEKKNVVCIPAYMADFLFVQTIRNGVWYGKNSLLDYKERLSTLKKIQEVQEELNPKAIDENPETWIKSSFYTQMKMQNMENPLFALYRHFYIYNELQKKNISQIKEYDVFYYYLAVVCIHLLFDKFFSVTDKELEYFVNQLAESTLRKHIEILIQKFRIEFQEICTDIKTDNTIFNTDKLFVSFSDSKYISCPLIHHDDKTYCVFPHMLLNISLDSLYYIVNDKVELGSIFEDYVNEQLSYYYKEKKFEFRKEFKYKKGGEKKTSDFLIWKMNYLIFIDCKMKKITESGKRDLVLDYNFIKEVLSSDWYIRSKWKQNISYNSHISAFTKDFLEMGKDIGKIFRCYDDGCEGIYDIGTDICNKKFKAIILTYSPWIILDYPLLADIATWYRNHGCENGKKVLHSDIAIISSTDFDNCISVINDDFEVFFRNFDHHRENKELVRKENGFLQEKIKKFHLDLPIVR